MRDELNNALRHPQRGFLSLSRAAEYFDVSVRTLYTWRELGMPSVRVRGRVLVPIDDATDWVKRLSQPGPQKDDGGHAA